MSGEIALRPSYWARWCNSSYKLDAKRQLSEWLNSIGFYVVHYIGYFADEEQRFNKRRAMVLGKFFGWW